MVFNKIDLIDQDKLNELKNIYKDENPIFISVRDEI
jgi:50S ribosomal subunit-associated GTPase HflX